MRSPTERIKELIPNLPKKDAILAEKFFKDRNFKGILELVESDIYKARRSIEEIPDDYTTKLLNLESELIEYMSYLYVPEFSDEEYEYY